MKKMPTPPKQGGPSLYIYMKQMKILNLTHGYYLPHHQNRWRWKWTIILCFNIHMYFNNFERKKGSLIDDHGGIKAPRNLNFGCTSTPPQGFCGGGFVCV